MEYTVKMLADEVGVSKQAISDKIKKLGLQSDLTKKGNRFVITEIQASLIKSAFQDKQQAQPTRNYAKNNDDLLYETVKSLQAQLTVKDEQIAALNKQIADLAADKEQLRADKDRLQLSLDREQALHAGTIQKQLLSEGSEPSKRQKQTKTDKKQGFLSRFFGKKVSENE